MNIQTIFCVRCLTKPAVMWTGHVLEGKKKYTAGWCGKCQEQLRYMAFCGHYRKEMGKQ